MTKLLVRVLGDVSSFLKAKSTVELYTLHIDVFQCMKMTSHKNLFFHKTDHIKKSQYVEYLFRPWELLYLIPY